MDEYRINGLTIKENLLQLAENGNKKFTESQGPGWISLIALTACSNSALPNRQP
jgi:hypothetical protein